MADPNRIRAKRRKILSALTPRALNEEASVEGDHVENPRDFLSQRSKVKGQKSENGIQSRETAKKDSDEEAARQDSAEDLTGGGGKLHYGIIA